MIKHTRKSTYILWLLLPSLALVVARSLVHTNGQAPNSHQVSKTQRAILRSDQITVRAADRGNPYLNLRDGHNLLTTYVGKAAPVQILQQDHANPTSLASADFDEDGVPDLLTGYSNSGGGLLALYRGNVDSIFPNAPEAKRRKAEGSFVDSPFFPSAKVFEGPEAADFIEAGDFDGDAHWDVVTAARGSPLLQLFSGNGRGDLKLARAIQLPGTVTAVGAGEVNRRDGLTDLAVGILGPAGRQVIVFESPLGALRGEPEAFSVPAEVTAIEMGQLDDEYTMDLAVGAGSELLIIHGRDRKLSLDESERNKVRPAVTTKHSFESTIISTAVGDFTGKHRKEIAVLLSNREVKVISFRKGKSRQLRQNNLSLQDSWNESSYLVRAKVSSLPQDDLVLVDRVNHQIHILGGEKEKESTERVATSLHIDNESVAVLPMQLNVDALQDLVILKKGQNNLTLAITAPMSTFVVNSTGDGSDCDLNDGVCSLGTKNTGQCVLTGECTLRAAAQQANASGSALISFSVSTVNQTDSIGIGSSITIDGTTSPTGRVELIGGGLVVGTNCLVRGLVINRAPSYGINLGRNNIVDGTFIGTDVTGTLPLGNVNAGINLGSFSFSSNNTIGGTTAAARNIISGNRGAGIQLSGSEVVENVIQGNFIGTDASGSQSIGNGIGTLHHGAGIVINGAGSARNTIGGVTSGSRNVVSGNGLLAGLGISIAFEANANLVQGNFIGTNVNGTASLPNLSGVDIDVFASANTVGGSSPNARNLISGNTNDGVLIGSDNNSIQGNYIGTDVSGTSDLGNGGNGIRVSSGANCIVGGTTAEARNIISGNNSNGIELNNSGNQILGNFIGTQMDGTTALANGRHGVFVAKFFIGFSANNNTIGGKISGAGNRIQNNGGDGVFVASGTGNAIVENSIFANVGLGIDLGTDGVTSNDSDDVDSGANNLQNFPVLTSATSSSGKATIQGTLNSKPSTAFTVAIYSNSQCDPSGFGEGEAPVSSSTVTTDASGDANFIITLSSSLPIGNSVVATATDPTGNTSEFSRCLSVSKETFHLSVLTTGNGLVTSQPSGIACPTDCEKDYPDATQVGLIPMPGNGSKFDGWSGECQGSGPCMLSMTTNRSVRANFSPKVKSTLLVTVTAGGSVISVPGSFNCPGPQTCAEEYDEGEEFSLVAMAVVGWEFRGWQGSCLGILGPCHVTMNGPVTTTAVFGRTNQRRIISPVGIPRLPSGMPVHIKFTFGPGSLVPLSSLKSGKDWGLDFGQGLTDVGENNVKVELSRDNGTTFETLFANVANVGSVCWTVTGPSTTEALIRVSSISDPSVFAISDEAFVIVNSGTPGLQLAAGPTVCEGLSTSDQRSPIRGTSFYADRYSFFGSIGQQIAITFTSQALNSYLYLVGPDGTVIAQDNDGGGATDARIPAASGFLTLPATGTYVIEATSFDANALGDYQLRLDTGAVLLTAENTERALALDSVTMIRDPFALLSTNFSSDQRTRISLFAANLELVPGETNSVVTAQAEDSQHRVYPLTVEFVGRVPNFPWLTQINVRLPDQLANAGDVWVSTRLRGVVGNRARINIK